MDSSISSIKSRLVLTLDRGFSIDRVGEGTSNPACDYDIEFIHGCPHHCVYCQQIYLTHETPFIAVWPDLDEILAEVRRVVDSDPRRPLVFEVGNLTDMLAMEPRTGALERLIPFWADELGADRARLHFLTKSAAVEPLLRLNPNGAVRVGFSLNLPEVIRRYELGSASLEERLEAIRQVLAAGYRLHLSLSALLARPGNLSGYQSLVRELKRFLSTCPGFDETDLTLEALVLFQKKGGPELMRRHYPAAAVELLEGLQPEGSGADRVWRYSPAVRDQLAADLTGALEAHFPKARLLFAC